MGAVSAWFKNNVFLVAAISLPLLIILLFGLATVLPRWWVQDPAFDLLFQVNPGGQVQEPFGVSFHATGVGVMATVAYDHDGRRLPRHRLYRFVSGDGETRELSFTVPAPVKTRLRQSDADEGYVTEEVPVDSADFGLLDARIAPDGYQARAGRYRGSGLFGELFGMRSRRNHFSIVKDGRVIAVPVPDDNGYYYYNQAQVLGWISPTDSQQKTAP
jgi:hypothetical protein